MTEVVPTAQHAYSSGGSGSDSGSGSGNISRIPLAEAVDIPATIQSARHAWEAAFLHVDVQTPRRQALPHRCTPPKGNSEGVAVAKLAAALPQRVLRPVAN